MWSIWKLCRAHKSAERAMRDSFNSSFPFPTQIINRKVVEMSMGMTNLINFDFCAFFRFSTFLTNYEYDKNISVSFVDTGEVGKRRGRLLS